MRTAIARRAIVLLLAVLGVGLPAGRALAADRNRLHMERLDLSHLPDLRVYMTYVDGDGAPITGKTAGDFKLVMDNIEPGPAAKLVTFDQLKEPAYVIGVVQLSPAMTPVLDDVKRGYKQLAEGMAQMPGSKMGLLGYAADVKRLADTPVSGAEAQGAIGKLAIDPEGTEVHLLDALRTAIDLLKAEKDGGRKLIVVFTDGIDQTFEKKAYTEIGRRAEEAGILIDPIGYNSFEPGKLRFLAELARNSRGTERGCKAPTDISARFANVLDEIQKQYVATFSLPLRGDDKEHTFQVLNEAGGSPVYSETINRVLPAFTCPNGNPPPCSGPDTGGGHRIWLWLLLLGGPLGIGLLAWLLLRNRGPEPMPQFQQQQPVQQQKVPPAQQPMGNAARTMIVSPTGDMQAAWIVWVNGVGADKDKTFTLDKPRQVIGRAPDCDVIVDDRTRPGTVSSHHCEISRGPDGFVLTDLGSANGVVVNNKKVQRHVLIDNDTFNLGPCQFKFKSIG